jgi:hypothetical protein
MIMLVVVVVVVVGVVGVVVVAGAHFECFNGFRCGWVADVVVDASELVGVQ